jgi:hypothetical protein
VLNAGTIIVLAETVDPPSKTSEPTIYWPSHAEEEKELEMREEGLYVKSLKLKVAEEVENEELPEHLEKLYHESVKSVHNATDRQMIKNLLLDHQEVFSIPGQPLEGTVAAEHAINTGDHLPIRQKLRRMGQVREEATAKELDKLIPLTFNII